MPTPLSDRPDSWRLPNHGPPGGRTRVAKLAIRSLIGATVVAVVAGSLWMDSIALLTLTVPLLALGWLSLRSGEGLNSRALSPPPKLAEVPSPTPDRPLRVLVVDDIPLNRQVVLSMLEGQGLELHEAGSGEEALAILLDAPVDLVFLDVHMPEVDGYEVARRLRARGDCVPLVALTADSIAGTREHCLAAGMDAFVNKPAPPQELVGLVQGLTRSAVA